MMINSISLSLAILLVQIALSYSQPIPPSPYGAVAEICATGDKPFSVKGFPGTPHSSTPFSDEYLSPVEAVRKGVACRKDGHCMNAYEFDVVETQIRVFDNAIPACKSYNGTWFIAYNGKVPGPTITHVAGHETFVRYNNKIGSKYFATNQAPCNANGRHGHPLSVHFHGSASLPGYDGWAEDEACTDETKDYIYPNNRATTGWHHDHAIHETALNAYYGMAAMSIITDKKARGGCGAPYNLENVEDKIMILQDKVLDTKCQLYSDIPKAHKDDLYGDINLVSGIPWPKMKLEPKWYRFRFLDAAVSRSFIIKVKDSNLQDVHQKICKVIGNDGGYRTDPATIPESGLLIGVAERYDVVCDFTKFASQTLYLWNHYDPKIQKDLPMFCNSHLLARFTIGAATPASLAAPIFNPLILPKNPLFQIVSQADVAAGVAMANADKSHREFAFGRSNGHWTINGETWATARIAADDVGQNTWEVWKFKSGGGWHHPVHIHLIDLFIIRRVGGRGVQTYEFQSPKDIFYLGPGETVYIFARFGPHKGDYMFHCHNLIHEDNDMMRAIRIANTTMGPNAASGSQYVLNPLFGIVYNNYKYKDPVLPETNAKPTATAPVLNQAYLQSLVDKNLYRIIYPLPTDIPLMKGFADPWQTAFCPLR